MAFLDNNGLKRLWSKIATELRQKANKVHKHSTEDISGLQKYVDSAIAGSSGSSKYFTITYDEAANTVTFS